MRGTSIAVLSAALLLGLTGCGTGDMASTESLPNPGEEGGKVTAMASITKTLYYEGACWWLKCATGTAALGACGYGCSDTRVGLARDYATRMSCGASVRVSANGRTATAIVWDSSCCGRFEGTKPLMNALAIGSGDGTCTSSRSFTYGYGQATATFTW
jgi:hypothetical protein